MTPNPKLKTRPAGVVFDQNSKLKTFVVGLMSGTSVDAVDVALCRFEEDLRAPGQLELELVGYSEQPFPPEIKAQVFAAFSGRAGPSELCELNFGLGEVFAQAVLTTLKEAGYAPDQVELVASHGQTIYHQVASGHRPSTLQMGDGAVLAARTGVTVAHDFRPADMAAGGQGAPLVPYFDLLFFADPEKGRALQNIGGIGNITFLPPGAGPGDVLALDTGPGNALIDAAARYFSDGQQQFDQHGQLAAQGRIDPGWLAELLAHPYFEAALPKSTGRELFGDQFAQAAFGRATELGLTPSDVLATLTALTAKSIALAVRRYNPTPRLDELIVSGGGARNPVLMGMLEEWLPGVAVVPHDRYGLQAEAKEAVAFALLGYELLRNRPSNLPGCTGASRPTRLGKLAPGCNWAGLLGKYGPLMLPDTYPYNSQEELEWPTTPRLTIRQA